MDQEKRRAVSDFYREEFLRHLEHLELTGIIGDVDRRAVDCAYRNLVKDLDRVCWHTDFPAMAAVVLRGFDALTKLSRLDSRRAH